jgi:hypothetical protein
MTEIETIAKRLTKAQRGNLDVLGSSEAHGGLWCQPRDGALPGLVALGLVERDDHLSSPALPGYQYHTINDKGLAVRDYLKQQEERDDG